MKQQLIRLKELRYQNGYAQVSLQDISKLEAEINKKEVRKRRLIRDANDQRNKRKKTKENIKEICDTDENAAKILKSVNRKVTGRPRSLLKHGFMNTGFLIFFWGLLTFGLTTEFRTVQLPNFGREIIILNFVSDGFYQKKSH